MTFTMRSSARLALAVSTARLKAAAEAREKSVGCKTRRMRPMGRLLSTRVSVEHPDVFSENHAAVAARGADKQVPLVVDAEHASAGRLRRAPQLHPSAGEDVPLPPRCHQRRRAERPVAEQP